MASLIVDQLQYQPLGSRFERLVDNLTETIGAPKDEDSRGCLNRLEMRARRAVESLDDMQTEGCLSDVSFVAKPGEISAVVGPDPNELKSIVDLLGSGRRSGIFDGQAYVTGTAALNSLLPASDVVFIAADAYKLYIPGLSYYQTVRYNALLRVKDPAVTVEDVDTAVISALDLMGLTRFKDRVIPERPITRGLLGGELRSLRIAADIALMPSVIVLEEPVHALDFGVARDLMKRLRSLADLGRTVVCTFSRPDAQIYELINSLTLVVDGRTVFSSKKENAIAHFCSPELGYMYNSDTSSPIDFIMDICSGVERPKGQRLPPTALELQNNFELNSTLCEYKVISSGGGVSFSVDGASGATTVLPATRPKPYLNLLVNNNLWGKKSLLGRRVWVAFDRAVTTKLREYAILRKSLFSNTLIGLLIGYFCYNQGDFGDYTMSMFNLPYEKVTNIASQLFISNCFVFVTQVLNVHIICQKMKVYRSEQRGGVMSAGVFFLSTLMAEIPFAMFYASIFSALVYFMVGYRTGYENFQFFMTVQVLIAALGVMFTLLSAAVFVKEFVVRDIFLVLSFVMIMVSGFPFSLKVMRDWMVDATHYNPLRWSFESLLEWQFHHYEDGTGYLSTYDFQNFEHSSIYRILANFFMAIGGMFLLALAPRPNILRRRKLDEELTMARPTNMDTRMSTDSDLEGNSIVSTVTVEAASSILVEKLSLSSSALQASQSPIGRKRKKSFGTPRNSNVAGDGAAPPVLFMREPLSGAAPASLSCRPSASLNIETDENVVRGPTVTVQSLTVSVMDPRSPLGHKKILSDVSAKFDWGKLCVIMGAKDSGKSTLLHILSGADNKRTTTLEGCVLFDGKHADPSEKPWQRGAFVETLDDHFRDLTVLEILTYAMTLRCLTAEDMNVINENVEKTLQLLQLVDRKHVNAKRLSRGERRRLSIAEEFVTGPNFVLLDEPVTNLNAKDSSLIMNSFRELVNQEKTVVATMHEPSTEIFSLFDYVVLLSKGCVIYTGPVDQAVTFFTEASSLKLVPKGYTNPADFLADVSGCRIQNTDNSYCDTPALVSNWKCSARCVSEEKKLPTAVEDDALNPLVFGNDNPNSERLSSGGSLARSLEDGAKDKVYWSGTRSIDISATNKSEPQDSSFYVVPNGSGWTNFFEQVNMKMTLIRMFTILERELRALISRPKMIFSSFLLQLCIAGIYGLMMSANDASKNPGAITSYFGIGSVLIMLTMVQLGYYLHNSYQIFLKEHARGLYSMVSYWLVGTIPVLLLRAVHFGIYTLLSHKLMGLQSGDVGRFYYLNMFAFQMAHTLLLMFFIYQASEVRSIYYAVPGISFVLFFFSGMLVKPSTLPSWAAPWMPSISLIRWFMQAGVINEMHDNDDIFSPMGGFDPYKRYLGFFGWNGKTKFYCLSMTLLNLAIYFILCLVAHFLAVRSQTGKRQLRVPDEDDRLF